MNYYILEGDSLIIAKISDPRKAEFVARVGWDDDVERIQEQMGLLLQAGKDAYTKNRLRYFFPEIQEITEQQYNENVHKINAFNEEQKKLEKEIEETPLNEVRSFLALFPAQNPEIINFEELRAVSRMLAVMNQDLDIFDGAQDASEETLRLIYGVVLGAQRTNDRSLIEKLLKLDENETAMFSYEPDSSHGYINDSEKVDPATIMDSAKDRKPQKAGLLTRLRRGLAAILRRGARHLRKRARKNRNH